MNLIKMIRIDRHSFSFPKESHRVCVVSCSSIWLFCSIFLVCNRLRNHRFNELTAIFLRILGRSFTVFRTAPNRLCYIRPLKSQPLPSYFLQSIFSVRVHACVCVVSVLPFFFFFLPSHKCLPGWQCVLNWLSRLLGPQSTDISTSGCLLLLIDGL